MKNWYIPIAVLSLSGLGLFCASQPGQAKLQELFEHLSGDGDPLKEFNNFLDEQLTAIQRTLDHLAEALEQRA
ncbi:MAG TPA: hypothetical protein VKW06_06120 [Candidatus Angelobacter sp.]|nr:hypothetical protein [Candidatus Angelobacter sp.]